VSFDNLSISRKLAAGFAGVVSIVLVMSVVLYTALAAIHGATTANDESQNRLVAADAALSALVEQQNAVRGYVATGDESFPARIKGFADTFQAAWTKLDGLLTDPAEKAVMPELQAEAAKVMGEEDTQMSMRRNPATLPQALASLPTTGRLTHARELLKQITDPETKLVAERSAAQQQAFESATLTLFAGCGVAALLAVAMGWFLSRGIATPVRGMTQSMNRLAAGELETAVPSLGRRDEVGQMAGAVQTFKDAAIEKVRLEAEAAEQRRAAETERARGEEERARTAAEQALVVDELAAGLERLSAGALTSRLERPFAPAYEKLRADFNAAMVQLQDAIRVVAANAAAIRSGASEISQASDDLSRRTEQQAASL